MNELMPDSCQPDLDALTPADRAAVSDGLFAWVPDGPPRTRSQVVGGVELLDRLPSGISAPTLSTTPVSNDEQRRTAGGSLFRQVNDLSAAIPERRHRAVLIRGTLTLEFARVA